MMKITYQKRNGEIIERTRTTGLPYSIGETTSMGWKVLDIQYLYNGKYYHSGEYEKKVDKAFERERKIAQFKRMAYRIYRELTYAMGLLILIRAFEFTSLHFR